MKKKDIVIAAILFIVLAMFFFYSYSKNKTSSVTVTQPSLARRLEECGSFQNGSVQQVTDTERLFINIPKDYYPNLQLQIDQQGATAGYVSNGGEYGYAFDANGKPNCWSYYFEFGGNGTVDITSKSEDPSIPPYHIRFIVSPTIPQ